MLPRKHSIDTFLHVFIELHIIITNSAIQPCPMQLKSFYVIRVPLVVVCLYVYSSKTFDSINVTKSYASSPFYPNI